MNRKSCPATYINESLPNPSKSVPLWTPEHSNSTHKPIPVITIHGHIRAIQRHHARSPHRTQNIHPHPRRALNARHFALAPTPGILIRAMHVVVIEERIQPRAIDQHVARIHDAQPPPGLTRRERRVRVRRERGEGHLGVRVWLVVCRLGLDEAEHDVCGAGELVLVHDVVLDGGAEEPQCARGGFDEKTAAGEDGDLPEIVVFNVVFAESVLGLGR